MMESNKILDINTLNAIDELINSFENTIASMCEGVNLSIREFKGNDVVMSLVAAGKIGADVENNLTVIMNSLNQLKEVGESLKHSTKLFINSQSSMINSGLYL